MTVAEIALAIGVALLVVLAALLLGGALLFLARVVATIGPHCRCGHHRNVHWRSNTGCVGMWPDGENALGVRLRAGCSCQSYRPTEIGWWERVQHGTEEHELPQPTNR
jgi:hypothetical protein